MLLLLAIPFTTLRAQQPEISGYVISDAYLVAAHDDEVSETSLQGNTGFWFRRVYLTFDFPVAASWGARLRGEMNSPGDFSSRATLVPFLKDAYVRWEGTRHGITFGLSETPTWALVERVWGYRSVEKTLLDLQRIGSSRDIGVAFSGSLDEAETIGYRLMVSNGGGTRSETNKGKKILASLSFQPADDWVMEVYSDFESRPDDENRYTVQGFAGYQGSTMRLGLQYVYQQRQMGVDPDVNLNAISVFGVTRLTDRLHGFARFDKMFDSNPDAGRIAYLPFHAGWKSNLLLLGLDVQPVDNVHFIPNIEVVFYDSSNGVSPGATVMPRMTLFVTFG